VEERLFEKLERTLRQLSVSLITIWQTSLVCRLGRSCPLGRAASRTATKYAAELQEIARLVAQLGGYVNHPNRENQPVPQTVWAGLQRLRDLAWAWQAFGPEVP